MKLSEAEIQLLASVSRANVTNAPTDRGSLEADSDRFGEFLVDWSGAYTSLVSRGLLDGDETGYQLTDKSRSMAAEFHRERPDLYWYHYQRLYQAAHASDAYTKFCRRVFGEDYCQDGQTDMKSLDELLDVLKVAAGNHLLDLGCGAGGIAQYISEKTGAVVHGVDYSAPAIAVANQLANPKLSFAVADMNHLDLPPGQFDFVTSFDTLYWAADLEHTLSHLVTMLKPGGQMGLFMNHHIGEGDDPAMLRQEHTDLSKALSNLQLRFETFDYTVQIGEFWHRNVKAAKDLHPEFGAEGNGFISTNLIREAEDDYLPDVNAGKIARYLYHVQT